MARSRRRVQKRNRRGWLGALLIVALIGLLMPKALTDRFISLVQVIVPFQDWSTRTADGAADLAFGESDVPTPAEAQRLKLENAALRHRLAALSTAHEQLSTDFASVAGIRHQGLHQGRLIPARVLAADAIPWRDSRLVNAGTLKGVRADAPVASNHFSLATEDPDELADGQAVLAGEVLVGTIEQVGTHTARVRLLTDRQTPLKVRIARPEQGEFLPLEAEFWLVGTGGGRLEVRDVNHRFIRAGSIREGDVVLSDPTNPNLPVALTVGTISAVHVDPESPLLYRLTVEPPIKAADLRTVFVVDLTTNDPA